MKKYDGLLIDSHGIRDKRLKIQLKSGQTYTLMELEHADLSYVPCGQVPDKKSGELKDQPLLSYRDKWGKEAQVTLSDYADEASLDWKLERMNGVQLMTGRPTHRYSEGSPLDDLIYLTDIDIEHRLIGEYPEHYQRVVTVYRYACEGTPCRIRTKSDGERLSAYIAYLDSKVSFTDPKATDDEKPMLLEIFSEMGLSRLDNRYALIEGNILDIPILPISALQEIHAIISEVGTAVKTARGSTQDDKVFATSQIGDLAIDWRKKTITPKDGSDPYDVWVSQRLPTEHCRLHAHTSNRDEIQFTKYANGSIRGYCHNEQEGWWEGSPLTNSQDRPDAIPEPLTPEQEQAEVERMIANAPIGVNEPPVYRHWTPEQRKLVRHIGLDPDASYAPHRDGRKPIWITKFDKLYDATGLFQLNGQPSETETHRLWNSLFDTCPDCGKPTRAVWVDRFRLTTGTYCDTCHADKQTKSYLQMELNRKIAGGYDSDFDGFIGNDPFWKETALWQSGVLMHLAAAMALGKTTFVQDRGCERAVKESLFFIICVPRISLGLNIASKLNRQYGEKAFGIWYENSRDKFIGSIGAVCTLSSLPLLFETKEELHPKDCLVFIDEVDFSYPLTQLVTPLALKVKRLLRQALHSNGLVTAGQTEYTAVIEALADEMETDKINAYYKFATPHDREVRWIEYPDTEGKETDALAGFCQGVQDGIDAGDIVYGFCSERRQTDVAADYFREHDPLVYSALTKHSRRNHALLRERKLTDTKLFFGTAAADVGVSIEEDRPARNLVLMTQLFGRLNVESGVQETARVRNAEYIEMHVPLYTPALPVKPTETQDVMQYELDLKKEIAAIEADDFQMQSKTTTKLATTRTLQELAEQQPLEYVKHHLETVAGVTFTETQPPAIENSQRNTLKKLRSEALETENTLKTKYALQVIENEMERVEKLKQQSEYVPASLLSATEIRQSQRDGYLTSYNLLGQLTANAAAITVGFDDLSDILRSGDRENPVPFAWNPEDLPTIQAMLLAGVDPEAYTSQIRGYIAARDTEWIRQHTETQLLDKEWSAVRDYRFAGTLARNLCETLKGRSWTRRDFAVAIFATLRSETEKGQTFLSEIKAGALGVTGYKKGRFLLDIDPEAEAIPAQQGDLYIDFATSVLVRYLPVRVGFQTLKDDGEKQQYLTVLDIKDIDVFERALNCWLAHNPRSGTESKHVTVERVSVPTERERRNKRASILRGAGHTIENVAKATELSQNAVSKATKHISDANRADFEKRKAEAVKLRKAGKTVQEIAEITGLAEGTVSNHTKHVPKELRAERDAEIVRRWAGGKGETKTAIADDRGISRATVNRALSA